MKMIIIYKNKAYCKDVSPDIHVFYLRDNLTTNSKIKAFLGDASPIDSFDISRVNLSDYSEICKYENKKWYFWEPDFDCWDDSTEYREYPELAPEVQYELMLKLALSAGLLKENK